MIAIDTSEFARAAADLKAAGAKLPDALRTGVTSAAEPIAEGIRRAASWSTRIPDAVGVSPTKKGAVVWIDPEAAPEAGPLNNEDQGGSFRHPVYGNDWWVEQEARPFFAAGARAGFAAADRQVDMALTRWERSAGFR